MEELKAIVQRMIDAGEPEDKIREAVRLYKEQNVGKEQGSTEDPTMSQESMGSQLDSGSSESVSWFDQTWFGRGVKAASTTGEATNLMSQNFSNISKESIQEFIKAKEQESKSYVESERMKKFQEQYVKEGKTWSAFFRGVSKQPGLLPELFVQSLGTQVGTLIDSPTAALGAAATGAAGGAAVGAVPGAIAGAMGGLATSMEAALTFGELIETRLKEKGQEFTDENIKALLETEGKEIRNKAVGRGLAIGTIEGFTGGLAGKAAVATKGAVAATRGAKTATLAASATGVGVEAAGGALGEITGRAVAGQEMDAAEIGFEAITGTTTAPVNVLAALNSAKQPVYRLNGEKVTYEQMKDFVDTADDIDIAKAEIKMENDFTGIGKKAKAKQEAAEAMVKLSGDVATQQEVKTAKQQNIISETIAFAETQGEKIGKDVKVVDDDASAQEFYDKLVEQGLAEEKDVKGADGFIIGDSIIINKDVAGKSGQINVGAHEILHGILAKHLKSLVKVDEKGKVIDDSKLRTFINDFKNTISKESRDYIENIINERNKAGENLDLNTTDEWLTIYSDGITKNEISFNEGVFTKFRNFIQNIFRKFGYNKEFGSGLDTYNFMRDYQKSVKEGALSQRAVDIAGGGVAVTDVKQSRSQLVDTINDLQQGATTKADFQKPETFNKVFEAVQSGGAVNNYIRSLQMSPEKTQETIDAVTDRLINFDPAAKRKDGTVIGPKGLGEFIMANVGFGKKVAAKKLAVKAEKAKKTTTIDTKEAKELEDTTPTETTEVDKKDVKLRKLNNFDIELQDGLVDAEIIAEVESLLERNPKDLEARMEKLILTNIRKKLDNTVGKIAKNKETGNVEATPEYEKFIRGEFDEVVSSLGIDVIRKSYKPWFEQTKTGTKDYKNIDPVTGKVSNYRKDTFINKANKIKYIKFFLEGKPNVLRERRTALLRRIARRKAEVAIDNYIETNSSNIDAVVDAKLRTLTRTAKNIQNERVSFDSVKFSNTVKKRVNDYYNTGNFNTKGHALEQVLIDLLKSYNLPTKYLKVAVEYATEEGGIADINLEVLGEALRIEVKLNENVPMGSVLASDYNLKNKILKVAKSSMDKSLPFDQIIDLVRDDIINLVNVYNGKVTAYNNKNNTNEPLMDAENPTGHRMVESIYNEMVNEGVTAKIFQNSLFVSPNAQPLIDHYLNKFAGAVKAIEIFGKGLYSFVENSVLGPNVPYILDMARVETHVRVFNSGRVKQTVKGKRKLVTNKIGDGYIRFQLQFQNSLLKNSLKTPKKPVSLTRKEDMLFGLGIPVKENVATEFDTAVKASRSIRPPKGITVLDFDDTLATTESLVKYTTLDGETGTLNAEEFASTYENLLDKGYTFDFSDFNKVVKGKVAPLFQKALKLQGKFGPENMFVLTARPPQAAKAIFDFLKANGLNIPLKNITGLGNSTSEAKALWIAGKVSEGFNDFYFADDALQNVQAVKNMLDQFDVKSKVQQAKVKFSKSMNNDFNKILEDVTGIDAIKRFSDVKARKRGASKGKFRLFIPPSHEDFVGLLYNFMGKGRKGDQHRDFFEQALVRPLNRAYREIDTAKQAIANDYKQLNKQFTDVKKKLRKKTPDGDFTFEDATRVYLWNKHGYDIPGLSPTDQANLVELVMADQELRQYAETLNIISKQEKYVDPGNGWEAGNIKTDLMDATGRVGRAEFFAEFNENADILFSPENLNKIEAAYGKDFRSALEDILHRIKTGVNRPKGQSGTINSLMNYLNGSVGTVMFFNVRSAILQQMSIVNYINFADNNLFAAAKAFANQKQYWKDFAFIFNSDMLKQRRGGIGTDINGADLAQAVEGSKQPTKIVISKLLKLGFLPTQIGDNIAIATGGATFYRNRINKYIKDGLSQKEAETKAFTDFQDLTQSTQQSSRPDMTSKQQASWIGKLVLNFQNITSQYNRIIKKAALDIGKGRISPPYTTKAQSNLGNLSKILYYGGIQNVIFYSLQTALFAVMFDDDQDEDQILKKRERVINGSIDSILRGAGIYGAVASTLKNMIIKFKEQREKGYNKDESAVPMELLNFSPVVGIKIRQLVNAEKTLNYNENVISEMETFDADNPQWSAVTNYTQALTNFPANRLYQKSINMRNALDKDYTNFQRVLFFSGYTTWSLGLGDNEKIIEAKEKSKINKANTRSRDRARTRSGNRIR